MRGRIVFHDGTTEKPLDVISVTDTADSIIVNTATENVRYSKSRVFYFQIVWHPPESDGE